MIAKGANCIPFWEDSRLFLLPLANMPKRAVGDCFLEMAMVTTIAVGSVTLPTAPHVSADFHFATCKAITESA